MTVYYENETEFKFPFSEHEHLQKLIRFVTDFVACPYETEVSVTIVGKERIQEINREFRQVDRPTDVLSFPMMEYDKPSDFQGKTFQSTISLSPGTGELVLGDIILCAEVISEQADEYGHSELREFSFLVVHSMLHLFGYDHMEESERIEMEELQKDIMEKLGINR